MTTPTLHNPDQVLLGAVGQSDAEVTTESGDPTSFPEGIAVRCGSNNLLSLASGPLLGVSLGRSVYDEKKTAVVRAGQKVPLRLTDEGVAASIVKAELTFRAKNKGLEGNSITIALVDGGVAGSEEVEVDGTDIVVSMDDGVSTAQDIADAIAANAEASALIGVEISAGDEAEAQVAFAEDALEGGVDSYGYVVEGKAVEIDLATGKAVSDGQATGAIYSHNGHKTGVLSAFRGTVDVAVIDMPGGL